jgi:hypothetical protein
MKYIITVKIQPEYSEKYIEFSQEFNLDIHPNKQDELMIDEMILKIKKIHIDLHENICFLYTDLIDNLPVFENKNWDEIESILMTEYNHMKDYGWILTDHSFERKIDDIPLIG